ncbi:MAG: pentapeptide repeat-containing protein, partial [Myxococcales bacterium]|nr:pentapeptide repeat-containing protein [Myxococcales bacterium]
WDIAVGWQRGGARVGADADLPIEVAPDRLREIAQAECEGVDADDVAHVVSSVLLVAQGAGSRGFLLGHRSFIEYLSVRYWLSELLWMLPKKQTDEDVVRVIRVLGEGDILDLSEAAQEFCDELWSLLELVVGSDCAARQVTLNKLASIIDDPTMIRAEAGHVSVDSDPRMPVRWFAMAVAGAVSTGISRPGRWYDQPVSRLDILPWRATQVPTLIRLSAVRGRHARSIKVPGVNLSSCELAGIWAPGADLAFADLSGANLTCATLTDASLFSAVLSNARCVAAWLSSCDLAGSQLDNCDLSHAHLDSAELDSADMRGAWIVDASFAGASMASVKMIGCELGKDAMVMASHQGRSVTARHSVRARLAGALYSSSTTLTDPGFTWPDDAINVDELAPDDAENGTA